MTERAVASALEDVMSAVDVYRLDPSEDNRRLLKGCLLQAMRLVAKHVGGQT